MTLDDDDARLRAVLHEATGKDVASLPRDEDLTEALDLDSLAALRMLAAVEKRFGARLPDDRLAELRTIDRLLEAIAEARPDNPDPEDERCASG